MEGVEDGQGNLNHAGWQLVDFSQEVGQEIELSGTVGQDLDLTGTVVQVSYLFS